MSRLFDVDNDMHGEISNQPYLLQIDINAGSHIPKGGLTSSDPYVIVRFGNNEVARTEVDKWTVNPKWNSSFTIPLLHIQHPLILEIWDSKTYDTDEILGNVTFDLQELGSNILLEDDFALEQAAGGRKNASGHLSCGIYLEKRKHMINISHLPTNTTHSHEIDRVHSTALSKMLKQEYNNLHILPSIQEALEKSDFLKQKDFDFSHFRDVLHDMHLLTTDADTDTDVVTDADADSDATDRSSDAGSLQLQLLPMSLHRIGDNNSTSDTGDNPVVKFSKSTRINISTSSIESSFVWPYSKYGRHVLVLETEKDDPLVMVWPNQFMVWACIRSIRRSAVKYQLQMKASGMSEGITAGDLYRKNHVCGPAADEDGGVAIFNCAMRVVIEKKLVACRCRIDVARGVLSCVREGDGEGEGEEGGQAALTRPLVQLKAICVPLDYAECNELLFRFDLLSAKMVLSRAERESSFYSKSTFAQVKQGMTIISSFATRIVVNFLDGRELISNSTEGISPFWNVSSTFGVHSQSFLDTTSSSSSSSDTDPDPDPEASCPAGIHIHMLTGDKGHETVLGSKLLLFSELHDPAVALSLASGTSNRTDSNCIDKDHGKGKEKEEEVDLKSTFIKLDMNMGLQLEVVKGENLVASKELLTSSFFNPFSEKNSSMEELLFDPRIEINCIRYDEDPSQNTYKKYTTQAEVQTLNPVWNETIIVNTADGVHSAHLVQLLVKDHDSGYTMGVVYIPIAEFFTHELIKGHSKLRRYPVLPSEGIPLRQQHSSSVYMTERGDRSAPGPDLGHLTVRLKLIQEDRMCVDSVLNGLKISSSNMNVIPIEAEIKTQLKTSNVHSSFFVCECVTSTSLPHVAKKDVDSRVERFAVAPGYDSLVLVPFARYFQHGGAAGADTQTPLESALLHQFKRNMRRKRIVQNNNDAAEDVWEDVIVFYFYENQRSAGLLNFSASYLTSLDRGKFTDETGYFPSPYSHDDIIFKPPEGYEWDAQHSQKWTLDMEYTETDKKGWSYGIDFNHLMQRLRRGNSTTNKLLQNVRRRRWQRIAVLKENGSKHLSATSASASGSSGAVDHGKRVKYGSLSRSYGTQHLADKSAVHSVFHNQRRGLNLSWSADNLMMCERSKYSNESGCKKYDIDEIQDLPPPIGYRWADDSAWYADREYLPTDRKGFVYGIDFLSIERNYRDHTSNTSKGLFSCRRQKLNRRIVEDDRKGASTVSVSRDQLTQLTEQFREISRTITSESLPSQSQALSPGKSTGDAREEGFASDRDSILKFCRERKCSSHTDTDTNTEEDSSPVCIPWQQVKHIDVVTPAVLSVIVSVNRFVGNQSYAPVDMEIFIYECPAEKLCLLMRDRLQLLPIRQDLCKLITSGSLTGDDVEEYSYRAALSDDFTSTAQSLASTISKNIFYEIEDIESAKHAKHVIVTGKAENKHITQWAQHEILHLKALKQRLMLYAQLLLASGLEGPDFSESTATRVVQADQKIAQLILNRESDSGGGGDGDDRAGAGSGGHIVEKTKHAVTFLLQSAEARICDYALSGWGHQGRDFEGIMSTLINGYFFSMVEILGYFFDSDEVLTSLEGNGDKLALINFILEHDSTLSMVIDSSLRPYELKISPLPLFSFSLNIKTLLDWYVVHLKTEIMTYVSRSFELNCKAASQSTRADYALPWEVLNDHGLMLSNIPLDVVVLLKGYFDLLGKADKPNTSLQMRNGLSFLYQKIRVFQIESFMLLIENYRNVLVAHDWTTPKLPPAPAAEDEDAVFTAMGEHLLWLSSIGNDMIKLQSRTSSFNDARFHYSQELKAARVSFHELSLSTIFIAMDCMSCIVFKSFEAILPLTSIYQKWVKDRDEKNLTERIVGELIWYLETNDEHLLPACSWRLSHICLTKFSIWYFSFLDECFTTKVHLTPEDIFHLAADCDYILKHFSAKMQPKPSLAQAQAYSQGSDEDVNSHLCMLQRFLQVKLMLTAPPRSPQLNELFADIMKECDDACQEQAHALAQLIRVVFQLRNTASQHVCEQSIDDDEEDEEEDEEADEEWFAMKIDMLTASIESTAAAAAQDDTGGVHVMVPPSPGADKGAKGKRSKLAGSESSFLASSSPQEWVWSSSKSSKSSAHREGASAGSTSASASAARARLLSNVLVRSAALGREEQKEIQSKRRRSLLRYTV